MEDKRKKVLRTGIFLAILLVIFIFLNSLFQPIWYSWGTIQKYKSFYDEPKNRLETVFVGPSVMGAGVSPMELYDEYGICSYNLSTERQPTMGSYYLVEEAYRLHPESLKTVVLDVSVLRSDAGDSFYHKWMDYMKMSDVKLRAIKEHAEGDTQKMIEFALPIAAYHDRWNDLNYDDFKYYVDDLNNGLRGYRYLEGYFGSQNIEETMIHDSVLDETQTEGYEPLLEENLEIFDRLVSFCKEHDMQLLLMKMPTHKWDSGLHNQIQELADKYGLEFLDYNFSPLYDEIDLLYPYDSFDGRHLNYYGGYKVTDHLGQYLVDHYNATDIRGLEEYEYLEEQFAEYDARVIQQVELQETETVTEYLEEAINGDNTVFLTVKKTAASALTNEQRAFFRDMGLKKLAKISTFDAYTAVINRDGEVVCEESKAASGTVDGISYELSSGKKSSSCIIDGEEYSPDLRGINIVVYNHTIDKAINTTCFDTHARRYRETYTLDTAKEVAALSDGAELDSNSMTGKIALYLEREEDYYNGKDLREGSEVDVITFLNEYANDENLIILAGRKDVSEAISNTEKADLAALGLSGLTEAEYGDSYIAILNGGVVQEEILKSGSDAITVEELGLYVKSAGAYAGSNCTIEVNGRDYASGSNGLDVVVYNQTENRVIDYINF